MTPADELTLAAERIETTVLLVDELAEPLAAWLRHEAAISAKSSWYPDSDKSLTLAREVIRATGGTP